MRWWSVRYWNAPESYRELRGLEPDVASEQLRIARAAASKRPSLWLGIALITVVTIVPFLMSIPLTPRMRLWASIISSVAWLPAIVVITWMHRRLVRRELWQRLPGLCDACGYNLTGNTSGTCPECGHAVAGGGEG